MMAQPFSVDQPCLLVLRGRGVVLYVGSLADPTQGPQPQGAHPAAHPDPIQAGQPDPAQGGPARPPSGNAGPGQQRV